MRRVSFAALFLVCGPAYAQTSATQPAGRGGDVTDPATAIARLHAALEPYRVDGDLRTHLFFRYADAPYTRATIASLIIAEQALREGVNPSLLRWSETALGRVRAGSPFDARPTRKPPGSSAPADQAGMSWMMAAVRPVERGAAGDDVDLAACLGARQFVDARPGITADAAEALSDRAAFLGMAYRRVNRLPPSSGGLGPTDGTLLALPEADYDPAAVAAWCATLWLRALSGHRQMLFPLDRARPKPWLIEAAAHCNLDAFRLSSDLRCFPAPAEVAVVVPSGSRGRRAEGPEFPRNASLVQDPTSHVGGQGYNDRFVRAVGEVLADAQVPADLLTPDALGDGDLGGRYRVLVLVGLDRLEAPIREKIRRFRDAGGVLLAVGRCLSETPRSGPGAIRFDLEAEVRDDSYGRLRDYVVGLRDRGTILASQVVPVSRDGRPVPGLRSETAWTGPRGCLVYLVNLTDTPLSLSPRFGGRTLTGPGHELIDDQPIELTASPFTLPPHAVWILRLTASRP